MSKESLNKLRNKIKKLENDYNKILDKLLDMRIKYKVDILKQYKKKGKIQQGDIIEIIADLPDHYSIKKGQKYKIAHLSYHNQIAFYIDVTPSESSIRHFEVVTYNQIRKVDQ